MPRSSQAKSRQQREDNGSARMLNSRNAASRNRDEEGRSASDEHSSHGSRYEEGDNDVHGSSGTRRKTTYSHQSSRSGGSGRFGGEARHREADERGAEHGRLGRRSSHYADENGDDGASSKYRSAGSHSYGQARERDEEGRFVSDEDDDRSGRTGRRSGRSGSDDAYYSSESSGGRRSSSRGAGHGGWWGDEDGHRDAAERGWEHGHRGQRSGQYSGYRRSSDD